MDDDKDWEGIDDGWSAADPEEPPADGEIVEAGPPVAKPRRTRAKKKRRTHRPTEPARPLAKQKQREQRDRRAAAEAQPKKPAKRRRPWLIPLLVFCVVVAALLLALVASKSG